MLDTTIKDRNEKHPSINILIYNTSNPIELEITHKSSKDQQCQNR